MFHNVKSHCGISPSGFPCQLLQVDSSSRLLSHVKTHTIFLLFFLTQVCSPLTTGPMDALDTGLLAAGGATLVKGLQRFKKLSSRFSPFPAPCTFPVPAPRLDHNPPCFTFASHECIFACDEKNKETSVKTLQTTREK